MLPSTLIWVKHLFPIPAPWRLLGWKKLVGFKWVFEGLIKHHGYTHEQKYGCAIKYAYGYIWHMFHAFFFGGGNANTAPQMFEKKPLFPPIWDFMGNNGEGMQGTRPKKRSNPQGHRRLAWQSVEYYGYDTAMFFKEKFKGLLRILGQGWIFWTSFCFNRR